MAASPAKIADEVTAAAHRLRIAIDGRNLQLSEGTGVATYGRCVAESLGRLAVEPELLIDTARLDRDAVSTTPAARLRRLLRALARSRAAAPLAAGDSRRARFDWCARLHASDDLFGIAQVHFDLFGAPLRVRGDAPDIMHWTYPLPLRFERARNLYTIHDLIPLRHPAFTSMDVARFRRLLVAVARHADHIVTVSESSRRDVIELLGCAPDKVTNTYQALSLPPGIPGDAAQQDAAIAATLGLERRGYLLYVGSIEPRKNVRGLIAAHHASGTTMPLVLVGPDGWRADAELSDHAARIVEAPWRASAPAPAPGPAIVRLRYVPYETLLALTAGARAMVYPSFAEGFGLPILEAMLLGTPVVTSRIGAMAEIADDAALLVDPHDPRDIAGAIARIAQDDGLGAALAARGRARAALFSLDKHAERLGAVYSRLTARDGPWYVPRGDDGDRRS